MVQLLCDVLLSPSARGLHRPLLGLKSLSPAHLASMTTYLSANLFTLSNSAILMSKNENFDVFSSSMDLSYTIESLFLAPEFRPALVHHIAPLTLHVVHSLQGAVKRALKAVVDVGSVSSSTLTEAITDRIAVLISLLNLFSTTTIDGNTSIDGSIEEEETAASNVYEMKSVCAAAFDCCLEILQEEKIGKDTMATAAVALCSASALPNANFQALAAEMAQGLLLPPPSTSSFSSRLAPSSASSLFTTTTSSSREDTTPDSWVAASLLQRGTCLADELQKLGAVAALSLLRALLQAAPLSALTTPCALHKTDENGGVEASEEKWCLLTDGLLCVLCSVVTAAVDHSVKWLALNTLVLCLDVLIQQLNADIERNSSNGSDSNSGEHKHENVVVVTSVHQQMLLRMLWSAWDDSQAQTVRLAQTAFGSVLKLVDLQNQLERSENNKNKIDDIEAKSAADFWASVALDLLNLGADQKRRYAPLTAIIPRMGAQNLLNLRPHLVEETLAAMSQNRTTTSAAASMLGVLWSTLQTELSVLRTETEEVEGVDVWRAAWAPQLSAVLCGDDEAGRKVVCEYAVHVIIEIDHDALAVLLESAMSAREDVAVRLKVKRKKKNVFSFFIFPLINHIFLIFLLIHSFIHSFIH